jgi:hypothetical protein
MKMRRPVVAATPPFLRAQGSSVWAVTLSVPRRGALRRTQVAGKGAGFFGHAVQSPVWAAASN